ncbi:MAG: organomercurial lyase, partial [Pseudonocardiaceae bacterium]
MLDTSTHVTSAEPQTGEPVEVSLAAGGTCDWTPREAVVVVGCAGAGDSADCSCPHTNFAASPARAKTLLQEIDDGTGHVLSMPEAIVSARQVFGTLLSSPKASDAVSAAGARRGCASPPHLQRFV